MFWVLVLAGVLAAGQQIPPDDPGVVIRSTTSLVQVRVVAQDSKGKSVTYLRREDFQVFDDRKAQPVTLFKLDQETGTRHAILPPTATDSTDDGPAAGGYSVLVLDWVNTEYPDRYRAKEQAIHMLQTYQPRQRVALYLIDREPRLLHEFTSDMAELVEVLQNLDLTFSDIDDETTPGRFDARYAGRAGRGMSAEEQFFFMNRRITDTFRAFEKIAGRLAHVPGRKSLIWLSDAFPLSTNGVFYYPDFERVVAQLNRSDVAVYSVDARGLSTITRSYTPTMEQFAERTGGTAFHSRNDLDEGMRLALEDLNVSYMLGFHVGANAALGPHEIRVRIKRPGIKLRYRESYQLAESPQAK
ncbi:MAG TPA: VWA domain-containing protein [Candidatus Sulfopaludibacter sp.]|jgi:VWFA-related protein|nr:VWA domain-containing protein [Candidatus Sulfopaludibacter sp.]